MSADQQSTQFVLVIFSFNGSADNGSDLSWYGFIVIEKYLWERHLQKVGEFYWPQIRPFGNSENPKQVRWNSKEDYLSCYNVIEISSEEYNMLKRLFGNPSSKIIKQGIFFSLIGGQG